MAAQKQDDQLERTFSSYVRIQAVVLKTYLGRWTIGRSGERGSGISVLPARYDDDDSGLYVQWLEHFCQKPLTFNRYGWALSSISEGVTRPARAGRMTSKVRRDFKIISDVLSLVSLVTSNIRGSSICSPKSLYKKTSQEILADLKAVVKTGALKIPEAPTRPTPSLLRPVCQACVKQLDLTHTPSPPRRRDKKDATKMNFSSCSDHSWIINDCYIFFPYLRVWVFLFLRTSFFSAQHVGPMVQGYSILETNKQYLKGFYFVLTND